jgi:hypothetical protein
MLGNAGHKVHFKADRKSGSGNGNFAGILADFLDDAEKLRLLAIVYSYE